MNLEERFLYFEENYTKLFFSDFGVGKKIYIGQKKLSCRFCKKSSNETTFNNISHAIPEFLGNKQFLLYEECDECNKFFSESIEDSLDKYTKPYRSVSQIKGKKKVPAYKSKDGRSRIDLKSPNSFEIRTDMDNEFYKLDDITSQIRLNTHLEPYIPAAVYKALVKIALSLIPNNELILFQPTINWILDGNHEDEFITPLMIMVTFIPGPRPHRRGFAVVLKQKTVESGYPYCIFVFAFANFIYQLIIPSSCDIVQGGAASFSMPYFPSRFENGWKYGNPKYGMFDLSETSIVKNGNAPIILRYSNLKQGKNI